MEGASARSVVGISDRPCCSCVILWSRGYPARDRQSSRTPGLTATGFGHGSAIFVGLGSAIKEVRVVTVGEHTFAKERGWPNCRSPARLRTALGST